MTVHTAASNDSADSLSDQTDRARLLVVEDEQKVANALRDGLEGEGYDVVTEETGEAALRRTAEESFALILLDLGLPGLDGLDVIATLRQQRIDTPIFVLTARDAISDRVHGLNTGADDYLAKPFAFTELLARVNALLRRGRAARTGPLTDGWPPADRPGDAACEPRWTRDRAHSQGVRPDGVSRPGGGTGRFTRRRGPRCMEGVCPEHHPRQCDRCPRLTVRRKIGQTPPLLHTVRGVGFVLREDTP